MNIEGIFKTKAIKESVQWGPSTGGHPQCAIDFPLPNLGVRTVLLQFSEASAAFSFDRLKAAGWDGKFLPNGFPDLASIGARECMVEVKLEDFQGQKRIKVDIVLGRIEIEKFKPEQEKDIGAKLGALFKAPRPARKAKKGDAQGEEMPSDWYGEEGP